MSKPPPPKEEHFSEEITTDFLNGTVHTNSNGGLILLIRSAAHPAIRCWVAHTCWSVTSLVYILGGAQFVPATITLKSIHAGAMRILIEERFFTICVAVCAEQMRWFGATLS